MATFTSAAAQVKEHLNQYLPRDLILRTCKDVGHRWRKGGKVGPDESVWLCLIQLLANVALRSLRHTAGVTVSFQAVCAARMRLPLKLFHRLLEQSVPGGRPEYFHQLKIYIVDGLGFQTPDNPKLAGKFGKPSNQRGESAGYPAAKMLALMEAGGGYIRRAIVLPWKRHEFTCLSRLFASMIPGSLLMGDRGLVSFAHLLLLTKQGMHGCFRLPRDKVFSRNLRRSSRTRKLKKRLGKQDLLIEWSAGHQPAWLSGKRWKEIRNQTVLVRQICFRICRKGWRTHWAWIATTLLDEQKYPAQELIDLYNCRWQIEVDFRDLKRTLGLHMISAKTIAGVQREVLAYILLYNLIRSIMNQAAKAQGVPADRISFTDAMRWLLHHVAGAPLPKLVVNPLCKRKTQPRRVKNPRHRYPGLTQSRAKSCLPRCEVKV
jgi:hypothetical protein